MEIKQNPLYDEIVKGFDWNLDASNHANLAISVYIKR